MPFPYSHLCVAERVLTLASQLSSRPHNDENAAAFLLGSIAPDAVHYRPGFSGADKKITHLCPVSGERWGAVTENDRWAALVKDFYRANNENAFIAGYCTHIFTDIYNNRHIWTPFREAYPDVAAKGYGGDYHRECGIIDRKLYQDKVTTNRIIPLLASATHDALRARVQAASEALPVTVDEIVAIRDNLVHSNYADAPAADVSGCRYITYDRQVRFISDAADFVISLLT